MNPQFRRKYSLDPTCEVWIGGSSWHEPTKASKFAWKTAAGAWARGGEHPLDAVPDEVALAVESGSLTWVELLEPLFATCSPEIAKARVADILLALSHRLGGMVSPAQAAAAPDPVQVWRAAAERCVAALGACQAPEKDVIDHVDIMLTSVSAEAQKKFAEKLAQQFTHADSAA